MKMRFLILILALLFFSSMQAQISRADLDKSTSKGLDLIEKGKFQDAIEIFNDILTKDPTEGKALLLRARTKYELGAFKGAKKDCFAYMDIYGIDAEVAGLLGKTEKAMENYKQALAYLKAALLFDNQGVEYLMDRADIFYNLGLDDQACNDWNDAALVGSDKAREMIKRNCKQYLKREKSKKEIEEVPDYTKNESKDDEVEEVDETEMEDEDIVVDEEEEPDEVEIPIEEEDEAEDVVVEEDEEDEDPEEVYPLDTKIEEIYVDDELTIIIADGIGSRKLIEKPDILILSDKSGEVVVNICVDRLGRVINPTVNDDASTITTPALVSLALRESSNFRFARSSRKSHCGTITYVITGSE